MKNKNIFRLITVYVLLVLSFVAAFLLQSIIIPYLGLQMPVYLLLPLTVSVAMYEKNFIGMFFGIFAGVLFDITSAAPDGIYALFFAAVGLIAGYLVSRYLRNTVLVALIMTAAADLLLCILSFAANYLTGTQGAAMLIIRGFYIPAFIVTLLMIFPIYFITASIEKIRK